MQVIILCYGDVDIHIYVCIVFINKLMYTYTYGVARTERLVVVVSRKYDRIVQFFAYSMGRYICYIVVHPVHGVHCSVHARAAAI